MQLLRLFSFETPPALPEEVAAPPSAGADVSEALADGQAVVAEGAGDAAPAAAEVVAPSGEGGEAAAAQPPA